MQIKIIERNNRIIHESWNIQITNNLAYLRQSLENHLGIESRLSKKLKTIVVSGHLQLPYFCGNL